MAQNYIKNGILLFVRRFYQPELTYADKLIKEWVNNSIKLFVDIFIHGFAIYLALFGLTFIFPKLNSFIYLGDKFWHFPFAIILIGIVYWVMSEIYLWIQKNKRIARG